MTVTTADSLPRVGFSGGASATVSVVICAFASDRWLMLAEAVASVARQVRPALETIVVVDHNPSLYARARAMLHQARVLENTSVPGLSGARNVGVATARGDVVAFLDDDAVATATWLEELLRAYANPNVVGAGGVARPRWETGRPPPWLPPEFYWTVGCSYRGLPTVPAPVRNPIGANMSFRRSILAGIDGFKDGIGRVQRTPLGCEETELAIRLTRARPGAIVLHVPAARVEHAVPRERASWSYFRSRCWAEGISKARVTDQIGVDAGLASERAYALRVLPSGVLRGLTDGVRGDRAGYLRAGAIVGGFLATAAGYLRGRLAVSR
jgi:glycosyltransferase involved in cell wall biosynthesis